MSIKKSVIDEFHQWHSSQSWLPLWLGYPLMKNPMDMWMYQDIIVKCKPDIIIETGTLLGGSALFLATICDAIDIGHIITIDDHSCLKNGTLFNPITKDILTKDTLKKSLPKHKRIEYLVGDSLDYKTLSRVIKKCIGKEVMVILDSDHHKEHVLKEMFNYGPLVGQGQYLIVEDTNINGHPINSTFGPGPFEAVEEWLPHHTEFIIDKECEQFIYTWNPNGYLKRI